MHSPIDPAILYFGTPVVLVSSLNPDGSANLAHVLGLVARPQLHAWLWGAVSHPGQYSTHRRMRPQSSLSESGGRGEPARAYDRLDTRPAP